MLGAAFEIGLVGQNRETRRAAVLISARQRRRIEIRPDHAARRRCHLDLGDEAGSAGRDRRFKRLQEAARRRHALDRLRQGARRVQPLIGGDLGALLGADLHQHVAHAGTVSLVIATILSSARRAAPEAIESAASRTPAVRSSARPATINAAAVLSRTQSRSGPVSPARMALSFAAFPAGSAPLSCAICVRGNPAISGATSKVESLPFFHSATVVLPVVVISSKPSPCTTQACSAPSLPSTSATGVTHCGANTPTSRRLTNAGFDSGPSRLNTVRVPS